MPTKKFHIAISPFIIDDLRERLGRARWPDEIEDSGWAYGTNREYLQELCTHWGHGFDWYEQQDHLNTFSHFRAEIDGFGIHFIHHKGESSRRIPILLIHGYPDSFVRFLKLIPLLTAEGPDGLSFDVVVPSIPGFGFSDRPQKPGMNTKRIAQLFARLMTEPFQVLVTDWDMPGMDGASLCRRVRESPLEGYLYILMLTGSPNAQGCTPY